ncbi:MAG: Mo25-like protein [Piptocephalis tieghemiana]|nr:MAG: Mo25-like protein [Piptocephalis tieghemiana]
MSFLFPKKQKSPQDLVRALKDDLTHMAMTSPPGERKKATEEASKHLAHVKSLLYGEGDSDPSPEVVAQLAAEVYSHDLLEALVRDLGKLEFEAKKDVAQIINNLLRRQVGARLPTVEYITRHDSILFTLQSGYENPDVALNCGMILRECLRHEVLAKIVLFSPNFDKFFDYVDVSTFDVASDAFATFKDLLTRHKPMVADYLRDHYDPFFSQYTLLLNSTNYVTQRQSLKLLSEILLDRANYKVMTRYIAEPEHLKLMMTLLRNRGKHIQFEAFHVFKVFVANPHKTPEILMILQRNRDRLVTFLTKFQTDRTEDEQFNDEKAYLIGEVQALPPLEI